MPYVRVNDVGLNYEVAGSGAPLLLLHGWSLDHAIWQLQIPVFSEHYQTFAVDLRGCGRSDKPTGPTSAEMLAADMVGLLDALGIVRAAVCGISLGGVVAAQMTLDYPERVAAAVWAGAPNHVEEFLLTVGDETLPIIDFYLRILEPEGYRGFWEKVWKANIGLLFNREFVTTPFGGYLIRTLFEDRYMRLNANPSPLVEIIKGQRTWSIRDRLPTVRRPVLVVVGAEDPTLPQCEEEGRLTAGAEYVVIENSAHLCNLDQPAHFNQVVLNFLNRRY
jgi:3-oxoadipate enol-lactonase